MTRPKTRKTRKRESCCVWILFAVLTTHGLAMGDYCPSTQHVEIGKIGVIHCSFDHGSYVIMWYNTTDTRSERPIVVLQDSTKSGYGYSSQEYGIFANGSLLIHNVTTLHEKILTVKRLETPYSSARYSHIDVHAVVKPKHPRPFISPHLSGDGFDYVMLPELSHLSCLVRGARPMVSIEWIYEETAEPVTNQTSKILNDVSNLTYTSQQLITYPTERSPLLSLLKCQAVESAGLLEETESLILIEKWSNDSYTNVWVEKLVKLNTEMSLDCFDGSDGDLVVWKKENTTTKQFEVLAFAELQRYNLRGAFHDDYNLSSSASLSVRRAELKHEGHYLCISNTGVRGYEVIVAVTPTPPYLIVAGCSNQQYCVIDGEREGNLTCRVQGVRPPVQLEFIAFSGKTQITFRNIDNKVKMKGNVFNVIHTAGYVADLSLEKVTVECREKEPKQISLELSRTRLDLFFPDSSTLTNGFKQGDTFRDKVMPSLLVMSVMLQILMITMLTWFMCKFKNKVRRRRPS